MFGVLSIQLQFQMKREKHTLVNQLNNFLADVVHFIFDLKTKTGYGFLGTSAGGAVLDNASVGLKG